jgi:transcriptional regulator with XRE-family HTH domain
MLSSGELVERLKKRGIKQAAVARVLGINASAVTLLFRGDRRLLLDEAKKIVDAFGLDEQSAGPATISEPVARLQVLHVARALGVTLPPDDPVVAELASDFRAFSEFVSDPKARESVDQVQTFFRTVGLLRARKEPS